MSVCQNYKRKLDNQETVEGGAIFLGIKCPPGQDRPGGTLYPWYRLDMTLAVDCAVKSQHKQNFTPGTRYREGLDKLLHWKTRSPFQNCLGATI